MADPIETRREGTNWRHWLIGIAVVVLVIFFAVNSQEVTVEFIVGETRTPLIVALLLSALLGALIGWLGPRVRRGGRDRDRDRE
jgi:uncharacterized integral membrane protein